MGSRPEPILLEVGRSAEDTIPTRKERALLLEATTLSQPLPAA